MNASGSTISALENVKTQLAEIPILKAKSNLSRNETTALKELGNNTAINIKKAEKKEQQLSSWTIQRK